MFAELHEAMEDPRRHGEDFRMAPQDLPGGPTRQEIGEEEAWCAEEQ